MLLFASATYNFMEWNVKILQFHNYCIIEHWTKVRDRISFIQSLRQTQHSSIKMEREASHRCASDCNIISLIFFIHKKYFYSFLETRESHTHTNNILRGWNFFHCVLHRQMFCSCLKFLSKKVLLCATALFLNSFIYFFCRIEKSNGDAT
jgi:hypothetical protein